ncbi:hypothetical protein JYU34_010877 [Plutella xylostella]|uniref:Uncharacterized protein n=1 Tax=Plutella xylostella TaxID=51655 RepID=A0ABQ7QFI1_PLUXY|nr:hypothetical protein JYU34_010877 [Plutella xylostella]
MAASRRPAVALSAQDPSSLPRTRRWRHANPSLPDTTIYGVGMPSFCIRVCTV